MIPSCPLCREEKLTEWLYEDEICWVAYCKTHPNKILIVLKRHTAYPTQKELTHLKKITLKLFPEKHFREPKSIRDHFHLHEL